MSNYGLNLTPRMKAMRDEILAKTDFDRMSDLEETCEGSASYHYVVHPSGIGDDIYLVYSGVKYSLFDPEDPDYQL